MCRFFGYVGEGRHLKDLVLALISSAGFDPLKPAPIKRHGDGWGYVLTLKNLHIFGRSGSPIYHEAPLALSVASRAFSEDVLLLMHARAASRNEPLGVDAAHPFMGEMPNGDLIFLAHNGGIDKKGLAQHLGLEKLVNKYPDSYFILKAVQRYTDPSKGVPEVIDLIHRNGWLRSASNIIVVWLRAGGPPRLLVYPYHDGEEKYYEMFRVRPREGGGEAFVSSTIAIKLSDGWVKEALRPGELIVKELK